MSRCGEGGRGFGPASTAAGAAEQQSLEWLWTQDEYDESYFGDLPRNGYTSVVEAIASGLDIRLDWPVARVDLTGEGVAVSSHSGQTESGSHVVVAVPLGVLKSQLLTFTPPLPPERAQVVAQLGFGRYEKVVLKFARPFWREAGWSHLVLFHAIPLSLRRGSSISMRSTSARSWSVTCSTPPPATSPRHRRPWRPAG